MCIYFGTKGVLAEWNIAHEQILRYKLEKLRDQRDLYRRQRAHAHRLQKGIQIFSKNMLKRK